MTGIGTNSNLGQNIQWILENQIRRQVIPDGDRNNVNLTYTLPGDEIFAPGTLEVWLSGGMVCPIDFVAAADGKSFTFILTPEDPWRLNCPPSQGEPLWINYLLNLDC